MRSQIFIDFLGEQNFIKQLINFDKDNMTDRVLKKIGTYCSQPDFQPEIIGRVSLAAKSLCMWVRAMEVYGRVYRVVEPKKQRLNQATNQLKEKQAILADAKAKLKEVNASHSDVTELLGTLRKFSFGGSRHLLSINIYFKTLISVVFTESSGAP